MKSILFALVLGLPLLVACAHDANDNASAGSQAATESTYPNWDDNGICRNEDGTFARVYRCKQNHNICGAVDNETQADDYCRDSSGRFASPICCTNACSGTEMKHESNGKYSCRKGNGQFAQAVCCNDDAAANGLKADDFIYE